MTCAEAMTVMTSCLPRDATRATIGAVVRHILGCRSCWDRVRARAKNAPSRPDEWKDHLAIEIALNDPEA